jgi:hypothetical protein
MRDPVRIARVLQMAPDEAGQAESIREVAKQKRPGVGAQTLRARLNLDGTVEIWRKESTLNLTHSVFAGSVDKVLPRHLHLIAAPADALWVSYALTRSSQSAW